MFAPAALGAHKTKLWWLKGLLPKFPAAKFFLVQVVEDPIHYCCQKDKPEPLTIILWRILVALDENKGYVATGPWLFPALPGKLLKYTLMFSAILTLKAPITTAADDIHKYFSLFFRENKT